MDFFASIVICIFVFLLLVIIMLIYKNKSIKSELHNTRIPGIGETRQNIVYVNPNDPLYPNHYSLISVGSVSDYINTDLVSDESIPIGLEFFAVTPDGRFLVQQVGSKKELWVLPSSLEEEYTVGIRDTTPQ